MRAIWTIFVSVIAAAIVGMLYDYSRPFLSDVAKGTMLEGWFPVIDSQYLMLWLFAIAGFIGSLVSVIMNANYMRVEKLKQAAATGGGIGQGSKVKGKAGGKAQVAGAADMPTFDIDKAMKEIKSPGTPGSAASRPGSAASSPGDTLVPPAQPSPAKPETGEVQK